MTSKYADTINDIAARTLAIETRLNGFEKLVSNQLDEMKRMIDDEGVRCRYREMIQQSANGVARNAKTIDKVLALARANQLSSARMVGIAAVVGAVMAALQYLMPLFLALVK